jgi:GTP-binding protein HflX
MHAELVIVDHPLTPVQQRNLEKELNAKVLDRTGLILEIFGARARTKEGTLQVELAHLNYQKGRLVRSWTHLERQRGGAGFLGGPGETQIESDRRALQDKIIKLKRELETVRRTRDLHRAKRKKVPFPVVGIVGYTNAGKSTLFNRLTGAGVLAEDMLFATLDPTLRRVRLPHGTPVILSDTVGFISDLPTHLIAAFRATLEEVVEADLIIHLRDISDPDTTAQAEDVEQILLDLGVDPADKTRIIEVWNKIDRLDDANRTRLLGSGKVEELAQIVHDTEAELVIVDHPLTPVQQRNLEKELNAKVLDRTGLILEIFGERARTKEGTLQVELAHLNYQKGRLVRSWTHLERQRGGAGFLGGPGETQIEADRRILQDKIVKLNGVDTTFDNFCVLLRRDGHSQLVYKHAISTIMPGQPLQMFETEESGS